MIDRKKYLTSTLAASALLAIAIGAGAHAQEADVLDDILVCQQISDQSSRLACFDAAAARLSAERDNGLVGVYRQDIEAVERDAFGFDLPSMPSLSFSMFNESGNALDPLDPATTPDRMASNETASNETVAPADVTVTVAETAREPAAAASPGSAEEEPRRRGGIFARLTNRGGPDAREETVRPTDTQAINGVEVVERDEDGGVERIVMDIERIREIAYGRHRFYMANGQVWVQSGSERFRYDENADNVAEIRRAAMGSYFMQINGTGRALRVRRVR
ncbi:hypothetical protein [Hyphobacterium sp.]|uniref:hypothetical protein n=1 Tax=Hyphobacterium sp. TaxID=2004662 RepID=UPI003BA9136A